MEGLRRRCRAGAGDDGTAIVLVVMCLLLTMTLSTALLGVVVSEAGPTAYRGKATRTQAAAEAGLDAGTALLRAATSGALTGDATKLPCLTSGSPLTGTLRATGTAVPVWYSVTVSYFTVNPAGQSAAWRTANALSCTPGSGPASAPAYALVQSTSGGSGGPASVAALGTRSLELVYGFRSTDAGSLGGMIHTDVKSGLADLCWAAPSASPNPGSGVALAACTGAPEQLWAYRSDYTLVLAPTTNSDGTGGLCLQRATSLTLQTCLDSSQMTTARHQQEWSYTGATQFASVRDDGSAVSSTCITASSATAGAAMSAASCGSSLAWIPDVTVGAGAAGTSTQQLVNYAEYGRCLDLTGGKTSATWMITYPCKQDPTSSVAWNQRWVWDAVLTRQIQTYPSTGGIYCLTSPASAGGNVVVYTCSIYRTDQVWTVNGDTGNRSTSYTIVDSSGRCLDLGPGQGSGQLSTWSSVTVQPCSGNYTQKWNAPPQTGAGGVLVQRETTTG